MTSFKSNPNHCDLLPYIYNMVATQTTEQF